MKRSGTLKSNYVISVEWTEMNRFVLQFVLPHYLIHRLYIIVKKIAIALSVEDVEKSRCSITSPVLARARVRHASDVVIP